VAHPVFGVGPGNWAVVYPKFAARGDPSLASDDGMTDNPWPSSDWVAFLSERGAVATICLGLALLALALRAIDDLRRAKGDGDLERATAGLMLIGTITTTVVVGSFDAVLLIAVPTMFFWTMAGALSPPVEGKQALTKGVHALGPVTLALFGLLAIGRSSLQIAAMSTYAGASRLTEVERAAHFDPGNYRIQMRLADGYLARGDCAKAAAHAAAARGLFANALDPKGVLRRCGVK
jgi:hypothetical protein